MDSFPATTCKLIFCLPNNLEMDGKCMHERVTWEYSPEGRATRFQSYEEEKSCRCIVFTKRSCSGSSIPQFSPLFFCIAHHLSCKTWFPKKRERKKETTSVEICTDNISPLFLVLSGLLGESCRVDCISSFNGPPPISLLLLLLLASFPDSLRLPSPRPSPNRMNECKYQISPVPRCHWTWKRRARCASNE